MQFDCKIVSLISKLVLMIKKLISDTKKFLRHKKQLNKTMEKDKTASTLLSKIAIKAIQDKLGKDITLIDFNGVKGSLFDYYVICTANSPSHADSLAEEIRKMIKQEMNIKPHKEEGLQNCQWVLLDYFDVIIHIFLLDTREFYNIESMWKDVKQTHYPNVN